MYIIFIMFNDLTLCHVSSLSVPDPKRVVVYDVTKDGPDQ